MTEPRPWREDAPESEAAKLVALAASVPAKAIDRASWDDVLARAARPRRDWRLVPAFALSVLAGVGLVLFFRPAPAVPPPAQSLAQAAPVLTPSPGARFTHASGEQVVLTDGRLAVAAAEGAAVHLTTPHVEIDARQARFLADVTAGGTVVSVEEGEVVVRTPSGERVVRAGESIAWPPAPDIPGALLRDEVEEAPSCVALSGPAKLECLAREGERDGLEAQAALYELGVLESKAGHRAAAERAFHASLARFPDGVLHPEVRLALLVEFVRARRFAEAKAVAADFERACVDDPRSADVASLRRALEALAP
ncbi:MAG: hypothetical protein AB1938_03220 [Myxococcota bacterium]